MLLLDYVKPIDGGAVSYTGRVYGSRGHELQPTVTTKGYLTVGWTRNGGRTHSIRIHQLVALAFCENDLPLFYNQVDHRDGDRRNNCASNLRWVDNSINNREKFALRRRLGLPLHTERELAGYARRLKTRKAA